MLLVVEFPNKEKLPTLTTYFWHKHLHESIISLRGEVWGHKTSLNPAHNIEVPVPSQESERSCICVSGVSILPLSTIFLLNFGNVSTDN
jgi:hypothetical protein